MKFLNFAKFWKKNVYNYADAFVPPMPQIDEHQMKTEFRLRGVRGRGRGRGREQGRGEERGKSGVHGWS